MKLMCGLIIKGFGVWLNLGMNDKQVYKEYNVLCVRFLLSSLSISIISHRSFATSFMKRVAFILTYLSCLITQSLIFFIFTRIAYNDGILKHLCAISEDHQRNQEVKTTKWSLLLWARVKSQSCGGFPPLSVNNCCEISWQTWNWMEDGLNGLWRQRGSHSLWWVIADNVSLLHTNQA